MRADKPTVIFLVATAASIVAIIVALVAIPRPPINHHYPVGIGCGHNGTVQQDGTCKGEH